MQDLFRIALSPADVDKLKSEDDKKAFIISFRELSKVLMVLNTFVEFEFDEAIMEITQQDYEDFRSKYFLLYEESKRDNAYDIVSILDDIDFGIELMATDRINVAYIMNLIRNVDLKDKAKQKREIEHIKNEMDRSDSLELRRKVELIKQFLDDVLPTVRENDSVDEAYDEFESKARSEEIAAFARENEVDPEFLKNEISDYEFSGIIRKKKLMDTIKKPFLLKTKIVTAIINFIKDNVLKYQ